MSESGTGRGWTEEEVASRLKAVHDALLGFLRERTRLDWFKHKVRWRLSRRYIWPGSPPGATAMLDDAVERDVGVEAWKEHMERHRQAINAAIERYNDALGRHMAERLGKPIESFAPQDLEALRARRITFQGVRDELCWRGRALTVDPEPSLFPELLSLRLGILTEEVREQIFREVAATLAEEAADRNPRMSLADRRTRELEIELGLRALDRYNVAKLLAESYTEGRRFMGVDALLERYSAEREAERRSPGTDPGRADRIGVMATAVRRKVSFLEKLFPRSTGTHERIEQILREVPRTDPEEGPQTSD